MLSLSLITSLEDFQEGTIVIRTRSFLAEKTMNNEVEMQDSEEERQIELQRAIKRLDRKSARKLIVDQGVKPTTIPRAHLLRFLKVAVESRDSSLVRKLLEQKPNLKCLEGGRILWIVVNDGDTEIATMLVNAGVHLNVKMQGSNYLHVLLSTSNFRKNQLAMLMIERGASINVYDKNGYSPLYYAVKQQFTPMVIEMLRRGAIVGDEVVKAAALDATWLLPMLIASHGADATTLYRQAINAIMYLNMNDDNAEIVKLMLDFGVSVDHINSCGWTALTFATLFERVEVVDLLLRRGADVNKKSANGIQTIFAASGLEESTIAKMLIKKGANIHGCNDQDRQYPIHAACSNESLPNIYLLLNLGADISVLDRSERTPFSLMDTVESLNQPIKYVIKHLALTKAKGLMIRDLDILIINESTHTKDYYEDCLNELEKMKMVKIYNDISFFAVFEKNIQELSSLMRNPDFVNSYKTSKRKIWFPMYFRDMTIAIRNAEKRKNVLIFKENILNRVLKGALPYIAIRKIAYYSYMNELQ